MSIPDEGRTSSSRHLVGLSEEGVHVSGTSRTLSSGLRGRRRGSVEGNARSESGRFFTHIKVETRQQVRPDRRSYWKGRENVKRILEFVKKYFGSGS